MLVSSHLLSEVAQSVDDVVVIARGVLRASGPLEQVLGATGEPVTRVRVGATPSGSASCCAPSGLRRSSRDGAGALIVPGRRPTGSGAVAAEHGVALVELVAVSRSLEDAFLELTGRRT